MTETLTEVHFTLNGEEVAVKVERRWTLLYLLREVLGLTGTKCGCGTNDCGACRVIMDGVAKNSCCIPARGLEGHRIETIEGLARGRSLSILQQAFIDAGAVQCGFCTPGMILSAKALLDQNPDPSDDQIREALSHNICRCTGYVKILEAVKLAARRMKGQSLPVSYCAYEGQSLPKGTPVMDAVLKVTGSLRYMDDRKVENMVYGKILRSPVAHARIRRIDVSKASAMPGVRAVVTYEDAPSVRYNANGEDAPYYKVERVLDDRVRYVGDKVAAVAADTPELASAALKAIEVEYEELPACFDPEQAAKPDAFPIHDCGNVMEQVDYSCGDLEDGFRQADRIFENRYTVPAIPHGPIEPHCCIADYSIDDHLTVWTETQDVFGQRGNLARIFGLPMNAVRVICPAIGGAFGSKIDLLEEPVAALLSRKCGRPVKITYTRTEEITSAMTRHAETIYIRTGVRKDGTITAVDYTAYLSSGAFSAATMSVAWAAGGKFFKMFRIPNLHYHVYPVFTNRQTATAMRGFGSPQVFYVLNTELGRIAASLGMELPDLERKNMFGPGSVDGLGQQIGNFRGQDCVKEGLARFDYLARKKACRKDSLSSDRYLYGVGFSAAPHGSSMFGVLPDTCGVMLKMNEDGSLDMFTGVSDMGNGSVTLQRMIVSQVTGVDEKRISVVHTDTGTTLFDVGAYASRGTYVAGNAAKKAADKMREKILAEAAELLGVDASGIELRNNCARVCLPKTGPAEASGTLEHGASGSVYDGNREDFEKVPDAVSMQEIASHAHQKERDIVVTAIYGTKAAPISAGAHFAQVRIDKETGEVRVTDYLAVHDVGKALNPMNLEGQLHGGIEMGIGYALSEGAFLDGKGKSSERFFRDMKIPKITDMPKIETYILDSYEETGPFGGKSIGECATVPVAGAIVNAVADAVKNASENLDQNPDADRFYRFHHLPVRKEEVLKAIEDIRRQHE